MGNKPTKIEEIFFDEISKYIKNIEKEFQIGRYRVDFFIPNENLVIELDGHETHHTKEQRTCDAKRQRYIQREGHDIIRFTGTEIMSSLKECAQEVLQHIESKKRNLFNKVIFIDWLFVSKQASQIIIEKRPPIYLSNFMNALTKYLHLDGNYKVYIYSIPSWLSDSIIEIDLFKYYRNDKCYFDISEKQVPLLVWDLSEHLISVRAEYKEIILIGDDLGYVPFFQEEKHIDKLLRLGENTKMIGIKCHWQNIDYVLTTAIGLELYEI